MDPRAGDGTSLYVTMAGPNESKSYGETKQFAPHIENTATQRKEFPSCWGEKNILHQPDPLWAFSVH